MKSILSFCISLFILAFTLNACLRVMNVMLVHDNARIHFKREVCPLRELEGGLCVVTGNISHNILGDAEIDVKDGWIMVVKDDDISSVSYLDNASHYRPFGKVVAVLVGMAILLGGAGIAYSFAPGSLAGLFKKQVS